MRSTNAARVLEGDLQCDQLGHVLALRLSEGVAATPHHVHERLKAARHRAVAQRRVAVRVRRFARSSSLWSAGTSNSLPASEEDSGWGQRWIAVLPAVALLVGLLSLNMLQSDSRDAELADVDTALLTDDLPPTAYADPGFLQFLKSSREQNQ